MTLLENYIAAEVMATGMATASICWYDTCGLKNVIETDEKRNFYNTEELITELINKAKGVTKREDFACFDFHFDRGRIFARYRKLLIDQPYFTEE